MGRSTHGLDMCTSLNNTTLLANLHCSKLFLLGTVSLALGPCCRHLHRRTKKRAEHERQRLPDAIKSHPLHGDLELDSQDVQCHQVQGDFGLSEDEGEETPETAPSETDSMESKMAADSESESFSDSDMESSASDSEAEDHPRPAGPTTPPPPSQRAPGIRLNLGAMEGRAIPPSEQELKQKDLEEYNEVCSEIVPGLFLSGAGVASNKDILQRHGITHIVNCVQQLQLAPHPGVAYLELSLRDNDKEDLRKHFGPVCAFIDDALNSGGAVLVHCHQGVSRSPALVMAYLLRQEGTTFPEVFRLVKAKRGIVDPKGGFCNQLIKWSHEVKAKGVFTGGPSARV